MMMNLFFIGKLAGYDKCRSHTTLDTCNALGNHWIVNLLGKMFAKGLNHGENHLSGRRSIV